MSNRKESTYGWKAHKSKGDMNGMYKKHKIMACLCLLVSERIQSTPYQQEHYEALSQSAIGLTLKTKMQS